MRQAVNKVKIEGYLSQVDLKYGSYEQNGAAVDNVGGSITVLVELEDRKMEIPVYMFAKKQTNQGGLNPAYTAIEDVMNKFVSIASVGGKEGADKVRFTGNIRMNEYFDRSGKFVSYPRINASFINKVTGNFKPKAEFEVEFVVSSIAYEVDADGIEVEPKRLNIRTVVPQYGNRVDVVNFVATQPTVIDAIEQYWDVNKSYSAVGELCFVAKEEKVGAAGFGAAGEKTVTRFVNDMVITGGSPEEFDGDYAFDTNEVNQALAERKARLEKEKNKPAERKKAPAATTSNAPLTDLGF